MKKILNKNRFLTVTTSLTLVISIVLFFAIYQTNNQRNSANQALANLKVKIQKLNYYRPSPTIKNIETIKENLKYINDETSKLEAYFGAVYNNALNAFIKSLEQHDINNPREKKDKENIVNTKQSKNNLTAVNNINKSENFEIKEEFIASWKKFIEKQKEVDEYLEPSEILDKFRIFKKYSEDKFNAAKNIFAEVYAKNTVEEITNNNLDDYILAALGLSFDFTRISCKKFVDDIQKGIEKELKRKKLLSKSEHLVLFDEFTTIPNDDQIPYIIKYCRLYEDLFARIAKSNINTLVSYKKLNGLRGSKNGEYLIYKYELNINASLESARKFLNSLQNAYKDNRIYVIKDINIKNISSKVDKLKASKKDINTNETQKKSSSKPRTDSQINNNQIVILLGASNLINIKIKLDYIIYDNPLIKI